MFARRQGSGTLPLVCSQELCCSSSASYCPAHDKPSIFWRPQMLLRHLGPLTAVHLPRSDCLRQISCTDFEGCKLLPLHFHNRLSTLRDVHQCPKYLGGTPAIFRAVHMILIQHRRGVCSPRVRTSYLCHAHRWQLTQRSAVDLPLSSRGGTRRSNMSRCMVHQVGRPSNGQKKTKIRVHGTLCQRCLRLARTRGHETTSGRQSCVNLELVINCASPATD